MNIEKRSVLFKGKLCKLVPQLVILILLFVNLAGGQTSVAVAANATTSVHIVKYDADGTVLSETTKTYEWLQDNLPVQGDGITHYYHQGPVFEGDMWDPSEMLNLKDKGAVKGTAVKDLCELVGGMSPYNEVMLRAIDGWHTEFAYENIYEPLDEQGIITLCWYNGGDPTSGEEYGIGYPGTTHYHSALQVVFMAGTVSPDGKYVFGNSDMKICLPDEKYQHFYEGLASTNGLSGKWISEIAIFSGEAPVKAGEKLTPETDTNGTSSIPSLSLLLGIAGGVIVLTSGIIIFKSKKN